MTQHQRPVSMGTDRFNAGKLDENQASEPTIIAEKHRHPPGGPNNIPSVYTRASSPPTSPEQPANPNPSQEPQYPADPMDPFDPNSPNPIEGGREELFPKEPPTQKQPNE